MSSNSYNRYRGEALTLRDQVAALESLLHEKELFINELRQENRQLEYQLYFERRKQMDDKTKNTLFVVVVDLLTGNHLLHERSSEHRDLMMRFCSAIRKVNNGEDLTSEEVEMMRYASTQFHDGAEDMCEQLSIDKRLLSIIPDEYPKTFMQEKLLTEKGYTPYCGNEHCSIMPRTHFNGEQFVCYCCGWVSNYPADFIKIYKRKWNL